MILQLVLLLQVALGFSQEIGSLRIMNGTKAKLTQFPYQVGLLSFFQDHMDEPNLCGGAILNEFFILTAAHCLQDPKSKLSKVIVQVGSLYAPGDEKAITVEPINTRVHKNFNRKTVENDLGLIKLPRMIKFNWLRQPVKLPKNPLRKFTGRQAVVAGWGLTTKKEPSSVLQYLNVTIISNSECQRQWTKQLNGTGKRKDIYSSFMCIDSKEGLPCQGDSGGPLVLADGSRTLVGVVSHGYDWACKIKVPDVSTRVSQFVKWIEINMLSM
ncbi:chymotrypsin-1 [Drosophila kikkawai]|uniref:Chymotrypsin-1 n=1 Tax=Drosophila kikkawai TaxID=30033 RepID=A0A6P4HPS5_DROKI|nr:chymotrypsin-1 [Drosophila kikkawai]